jgi:hypothetical protein
MSSRLNVPAAAMLGAYCLYAIVFEMQGSNLFAPAPLVSTQQMQTYAGPAQVLANQQPMMGYAQPQPIVYAQAQDDGEFSYEAWMLCCFAFGTAAGYGAHAMLGVGGEPTDKEKTIGAAGLGGLLGVVLFGSLPGAAVLAAGLAYGTTKSDAIKSAGGAAATVYQKAVDLEAEYEVLPKAKSAIDTVVTVADNLNSNYGLTDKIDEKLKISEKAESLTAKVNEQKNKLTSKVDELKEKASS